MYYVHAAAVYPATLERGSGIHGRVVLGCCCQR